MQSATDRDRPGSGAHPLVTDPPLPGELHAPRAPADPDSAPDCRACGSAGAVRQERCEVCDAAGQAGEAADLPPAAPPVGYGFLRLSDVVRELRGAATSVAAARGGEDLSNVVDRVERLLLALQRQFLEEVVLQPRQPKRPVT